MTDVESQIQKGLFAFCKFLPQVVEKWRSVKQDAARPLQTLRNLTEQLQHVTSVEQLNYIVDFEETKTILQGKILALIEEEMSLIKKMVDDLNKINYDLRNKLWTLEKSTENFDWDNQDSLILRGSGTQPPLGKLLEKSLDFYNLFNFSGRHITETFKNIDLYDEKSVEQFRDSFNVNLEDDKVVYLIALTQYVNNKEGIS